MEDQNAILVKQEKERQEAVLRKQSTEELQRTMSENAMSVTDEDYLSNPTYSFRERQGVAVFDESMEVVEGNEWVNLLPVEKAPIKTNLEQNAKDLDKSQRELAEKEKKLQATVTETYMRRTKAKDQPAADLKQEQKLLAARLSVIQSQKALDLKNAKDRKEKLKIELKAMDAEVEAREEYLRMIPIDHPLRKKAAKEKEKATDERRWAKWRVKILSLKGKEKAHEKKQLSHKQIESAAQAIKSRKDENCEEDAVLVVTIGGKELTLINMGKAYMGGSKISYIFSDPKTKKRYLYKKAENCMGIANPKGAVMTKIGADFQTWLDKEHAIPATCVQNKDGEYIGSIQELVDLKEDKTIDLEKWQQQMPYKRDPSVMTDPVKEQLLRFHLIDWLLCNFDTKGENLLQRSDGQLVSIDKEGALTHIRKEEAQKMSVDYTPHTDEPIYNIFFRMYRDGKIGDLPLEKLEELITEVEKKSDDEYLAMFDPYFATLKKHKRSTRTLILKRKKELRASYITFLNELKPEEKPGNRLIRKSSPDDWVVV